MMKTMSLVYLIQNTKSDKVYVGKTNRHLQKRLNEHFADANYRPEKSALHRSIRKYGRRKFAVQELTGEVSPEQAENLEKVWIILLRSCDKKYGYNLSYGGEGHDHTEETRDKMKSIRGREHPNYDDALDNEKILELRNRGLGKRKIAELTGYPSTTVARRLKELNVPALPKPLEHVSNEKIAELYGLGFGARKIAEKLGINSKSTISNRLKLMGIERRPSNRHKSSI